MSPSPPEPRSRRARIGLADAPLGDYRPESESVEAPAERLSATSEPRAPEVTPSSRAPVSGSRAAAAERAPDPRGEPQRLALEPTRSVNFHIPRSLDRMLARLKYELESEYGVRTSKTALAAAALAALPRDPLAALAVLRAYEATEIGPEDASKINR